MGYHDGLYHCDAGDNYCVPGVYAHAGAAIESLREAHNTFGHISEEYMKVIGDFEGKIGECSSCKKAKSTRRSFKEESKTEVPSVGHTIVSDVKMMKNYSLKGNRYILTFVDRKSRLLRVYFLKRNSEVAGRTKQFVEWVRTQREKYPKMFENIRSECCKQYIKQ